MTRPSTRSATRSSGESPRSPPSTAPDRGTARPLRTCIGCRRRAPAGALARFVLHDGVLTLWGLDRPGFARPAGRGASLHPDATCLRAALKQGAFARAFSKNSKSGQTGRVGTLDEADL